MMSVTDSLTLLSIIPGKQVTTDQKDQQLHIDKLPIVNQHNLIRTLLT